MNIKEDLRRSLTIIFVLCFIFLITACQHNTAPVSNAGDKKEIQLGQQANLDGSNSYDQNDDPITYQWVFTIVPDGSSPYLEDFDSAFASFMPDLPGVYIVELVVSDGELYSARDHVVIKVNNDHPNARPPVIVPPTPNSPFPPVEPPHIHPPIGGPIPSPFPIPPPILFTGLVAEEVELESNIALPQGGKIEWEILNQPNNSQAKVITLGNGQFAFVADMTGKYALLESLIIDGHAMQLGYTNVEIRESRVAINGVRIMKVGTEEELRFGYVDWRPPIDLTINWSLESKPELSQLEIDPTNQGPLQFSPDIQGVYEISLTAIVSNREPDSNTVSITVIDELNENIDHSLFNHTCSDCHNSIIAGAKSINHIISSSSCENCHSTNSWIPIITVDHRKIFGPCIDCHDGVIAMGKNPEHLNSTDACEACHSTLALLPALGVNHYHVIGLCRDCHNNTIASGKSPFHIPSSEKCESCHNTSRFRPAVRIDHTQILGDCIDCHNGIVATGKSVNHVDSSDNCGECHNTVAWRLPILPPDLPVIFPTGLDVELTSDTSSYQSGELIKATAAFTNNSDMDIRLYRFSSSASPLRIEISGADLPYFPLLNPNDAQADLPVELISTLRIGESITREVVWDQKLPKGEIAPPGGYVLKAYVLAIEPDSFTRTEIGVKKEIMLEKSSLAIAEESAVLTSLNEPTVKTWYEADNGSNITCRLNSQVAIVDTYNITPIQTLVAVPESEINCRTEFIEPDWNVFFKGTKENDTFSYHIIIDGVTGELKMAMAM